MPHPLAPAQILELSGIDARAFAHAQFTSDVMILSAGQWQWSAWLDPKGRVRSLFALLWTDDARLLAWLPRGDANTMATRLSTFVFRSKVRIQPLADYSLFALPTDGSSPTGNLAGTWILDLPGDTPRRAAIINTRIDTPIDPDRLEAWIRDDIAARLPWIPSEVAEEFTAQALGLDRLGAISFDKGCYPGQEIVARLHYRGGNKRECMRVTIQTCEPPKAGERIEIDATPAANGRILYAAQPQAGICKALAVLPLDLPQNIRMRLESGAVVDLSPLNRGVL